MPCTDGPLRGPPIHESTRRSGRGRPACPPKRGRRRQRLQHPGRHRQRLGQPDRQPGAPPVHLPDGHSGVGQEPLPVEHRGAAHLVHDPGQQARLHRAEEGNRFPRRDEPGDGARGRPLARARRLVRLRRAAAAQGAAHRHHVLPRPVRQAGRGRHDRRQAAPPRAQHDLRRHPLVPARRRAGRDEEGPRQAAREEAEGDGAEQRRARQGLRLCRGDLREGSGQGRADEQDGGEDADRGQRRRRARLSLRRRHRRRLVSDHAVVVAVRDADRLPAQVPHRQGDRQGDASPSSRPRTRSPRSAW